MDRQVEKTDPQKTDEQGDSCKNRQMEILTDPQRNRQTGKTSNHKIEKQIDRVTDGETDRCRQAARKVHRSDRSIDRRMDIWIGRQTNTQMET